MRHGVAGRKLGVTSTHRLAMFRNLAHALLKHEQITTTLPKAKELRPVAEKLITLGKKGGLANRRLALCEAARRCDRRQVVQRVPASAAWAAPALEAGVAMANAADMPVIELLSAPPPQEAPQAKKKRRRRRGILDAPPHGRVRATPTANAPARCTIRRPLRDGPFRLMPAAVEFDTWGQSPPTVTAGEGLQSTPSLA